MTHMIRAGETVKDDEGVEYVIVDTHSSFNCCGGPVTVTIEAIRLEYTVPVEKKKEMR